MRGESLIDNNINFFFHYDVSFTTLAMQWQ
jgi:hypothetical protein